MEKNSAEQKSLAQICAEIKQELNKNRKLAQEIIKNMDNRLALAQLNEKENRK